MTADAKYRRFQFTIADLLALTVMVAVLGAASRFRASPFHALPLLAVLYAVKYRIVTLGVRPWLGLSLYLALVVALLPYFWICVEDIGHSNDFDKLIPWIGVPLMVFTIPTVFFLWDVFRRRPSLANYVDRSLFEILGLIPLWSGVWAMIFLHWSGITAP